MFNKCILVLFLFSFSTIQAQKIAIELKDFPIEIKNRNFYISKVIDNRNDTSFIGWSLLNKDSRGSKYTLKDGLTNSFESYFATNLKPETTQTALILNVITLLISERTKGMKEGKARIMVQFLKEENGSFGKVFETSSFTESTSEFNKDIYTTHERRIRAVVNQCIKNLSESKWAEIKPDFVSKTELQYESNKIDTLSKVLYDTAGLFSANRKEETIILKQNQITMKSGIVPTFRQANDKHHTLWAFKKHFKQLNDIENSKLYSDYKAKFKLTFFALGLGALFISASFADDSMEETGLPNLGLAVPGVAFAACSIPIYIKTNRLARKTINRYNTTIENK